MSQLAGKTVIITGSSRGVGADTAQILAAQGANIIVNYRSKAPRANKVVKAIEEAGGHATAVQADVTKSEDLTNLVNVAIETYGSLDYLILNASGGMETGMGEDYAMRLNRDAQLNLARLAAEKMPNGGRIVFVTSHQAHFIREVETLAEYQSVAESKRAGEDALIAEIPALTEKGISLVVVSADMIDRLHPGALEYRRETAGRLYTVNEFAHEVAAIVTADVQTGHVELVGGARGFID